MISLLQKHKRAIERFNPANTLISKAYSFTVTADLATSKTSRMLTRATRDSSQIVSRVYTDLYQMRPIRVKGNLRFPH